MHPLVLIVLLTLLAALVAGLGSPWIGKTAAKAVTTAALFIGAFLSCRSFFNISRATPSRWSCR
jgi:NADH-quinone oxidoreductase subunit L